MYTPTPPPPPQQKIPYPPGLFRGVISGGHVQFPVINTYQTPVFSRCFILIYQGVHCCTKVCITDCKGGDTT